MPKSSSAVEQSRNDRKAPGTHKWRAKLFASDRRKGDDKQQEVGLATDVADFLSGASSSTSAKIHIGPPTPVSDTAAAQAWSSAAGVTPSGTEPALHLEELFQQSTRTKSARPPKRAKNKGLHVRFTDLPPLIIGVGGDEADLPPKDILRARGGLEQGHDEHRSGGESGEVKVKNSPRGQLPKQSSHVAQDIFKEINPLSLQRTSIRIATSEQRQEAKVPQGESGSTLNEKDSALMASNEDKEDAGVLPAHSPTPEAVANATQYRIRLEGQEVQLTVQMSTPSLDNTGIEHAKDQSTSKPPLATQGYTLSDIDSIANYSLCTTPSQQPPSQTQADSSQSHVPASVAPRKFPQATDGLTLFRDAVQHRNPLVDGVPKATTPSLRTVAHAVGSDALDDFAGRVQHYDSVFRKIAAAGRPDSNVALVDWIRAATWWFLKGRGDLERVIRSRPRSADISKNDQYSSSLPDISQAYVDLAKAWWVLKEVTPEHPELKPYGNAGMKTMAAIIRSFKEEKLAESVEMHIGLESSMRALTMSMKRNNLLPSNSKVNSQLTGLDMRIWNAPPPLPSYLLALLSSRPSQAPVRTGTSLDNDHLSYVPIGDTTDLFCYGSMFVHLLVAVQGDSGEVIGLPCVLSITREPTHWQMDATLASQDGQVCLIIQSDRSAGLSWWDVEWKAPKWQLQIRLTDRIEVQVQFREQDYNILCRLHAQNQKVMRSFQPGAQEALLFETTLRNFTCLDPRRSKKFPSDAIKRCRLLTFEKSVTRVEGTRRRKVHQGYRLTVITPPNVKTLSSVDFNLSCTKPVLFSFLRGEEGAPALLLKISDEAEYSADTSFSVVMTLDEAAQRAEMHSLLNGTAARSLERTIASLQLSGLSIRRKSSAGHTTTDSEIIPPGLQWEKLRIINSNSGHNSHGHDRTVLSESLRLCVTSPLGTMTDRINLNYGELQLRLSVTELNDVTLLRIPQEDLTLSIAENIAPTDIQAALPKFLNLLASEDTIRTWRFKSQLDANCFQAAVTGFTVKFDGLASSFAISRRRTVVNHKRWEASITRVQVIERDKIVQLVAFSEDFSHGTCMNFVLKNTDVFESFSRSSKHYIRIVDAKFALPKGDGDQNRDFLCLDIPEYPGQHDDIAICFDTEDERDRFGDELPTTVSKASRIVSLRR